MRDMLFLLVLFAVSAYALKRPWIGVLGWTLISIMNPHKAMYQAANFPVAATIGGATLLGLFLTRDRKKMVWTPELVLFAVFSLWMTVNLLFTVNLESSLSMWDRVMKINFMILVTIYLLHTRRQIMALAWVLVFSLGWYGVKGGIFTIATGGNYRVWGPVGTFIEGNNELALALIMCVPLMQFLRMRFTRAWQKHAMTVAMLLTAFAALGSHSRGALLAIAAMAAVLWTRSKSKLLSGIVILVAAAGLLAFMPAEWTQRMQTIETYQQDASAMGRINAWHMAWNLAVDRLPVGAGYSIYTPYFFSMYAPNPHDVHAAHSIYFQVLGEQGFIGLGLMLTMWGLCWRTLTRVRKRARQRPETEWVADLASMCQVSLVGYAVGGTFLSLAYFDLPYNVLALGVLAKRWLDERGWETEVAESAPAAQPVVPGAVARGNS